MHPPASVPPVRPMELRHGDVVRIRGDRWRVRQVLAYDHVSILDAVGCGAANHAEQARFVLPFEPCERPDPDPNPKTVTPGQWRRVARCAIAAASESWWSLRAAAQANLTLIPFQLEPALALASGQGCRFLIADAVGLGKTVQACLMIAETLRRRPEAKALVVSPSGLRQQWRQELGNRFRLDAVVIDAAMLAWTSAQLPPGVNPWASHPVVLTSIDYVKRPEVLRSLESLTWDLVVFDEAHNLAGRSNRAIAAAALADRARALAMLTATPHSGDDAAFARMAGLGNPSGSEPLIAFRRTREDAGLESSRRTCLLRVRPTHVENDMHDALLGYARLVWQQTAQTGDATLVGARLAMSVLARRACSSAYSLARSVSRRLTLLANRPALELPQPCLPFAPVDSDDDEPEALLGAPGLRDAADERQRLEQVLRLAQLASSRESKVAAVHRLLRRVHEPAIVFTEYRDTLAHLSSALDGVDVVQLHGGLTTTERAEALRRFTQGQARVLLATDTGSEGLNLHQRCRFVINLELPWTPVRLEQRTGRVDRIGQTRRIHAVSLVAAGTCEEATLARLCLRAERACGTLNLLTRSPDEADVAAIVLGQRPGSTTAIEPATLPPGIVTLDLGRQARDQARRIAAARMMAGPAHIRTAGRRPVFARIRGRRPHRHARCLWAYRIVLAGADGRLIWESLLPIAADIRRTWSWAVAQTEAALCPDLSALQQVLGHEADNVVSHVRESMKTAIDRWTRREQDLSGVLRTLHARLSDDLLQPGLFDRRSERLAADQQFLLDEALSQTDARMRELEGCANPHIDACELVFAVRLD